MGKTSPGLNYNWPYPVGSVDKLNVTDRNAFNVGLGTSACRPFGRAAPAYGRDEAKPQSGIDVFVDAENEAFYELGNYMGAYGTLSDAFPEAEIGYATRAGLSKYIRQAVETEAVQVF